MMADKLFTKRLRELTDEAIRESLAEISVEFEKRFGPVAWNTRASQPLSLTVDEIRRRLSAMMPDDRTLDSMATYTVNADDLRALLDRLQSLSLSAAGEQIAENANCSVDIDRSGLAQEVE